MRMILFLAIILLSSLAAHAKDIVITPKHPEKVNVREISDLAHALDVCLSVEQDTKRCEQQRNFLAQHVEENSIRKLEGRLLHTKKQNIKAQKRNQKDFSRKDASRVTGIDKSKAMATVGLGEPK